MTGSHISLFSGVGMTDRAAESAGFKTIATAEVNPFCRSVLKARLPDAIHFDDVRAVKACTIGRDARSSFNYQWNGKTYNYPFKRPLLVSGGFPCQDVSDAGYKAGLDGERSGLWGEMLHVIREFEPEYVLSENVASLTHRGLDRVINDLHHAGYDVQWDCIPAAHVGAPHFRDRVWITARHRMSTTRRGLDVGRKNIGVVLRPGRGIASHGKPLDRLPRAGCATGGLVFERPSIANKSALSRLPLMPTPTKSDGTGGPGTTPKRAGGKNLRTWINEQEGNGRIDPTYLEWMMGLPFGWTDPSVPNDQLGEPMA
ncbi:MAG: DNA-cytosine methyltransferase, partial [Steroidobacteraceae bacterium]|nr:DNA-cytosine methyltransferase [Steroidobacteraceae bacterium]